MNEIAEVYYLLGRTLFESGHYEEALQNFINAYNEGGYENEILNDIYNCYVIPNEDEFQLNFKINGGTDSVIPYEETSLDFIPVTDYKFYVFDKKKKCFLDSVDIQNLHISFNPYEDSVLIADIGDIRKMLPYLQEVSQIFLLTENVAQMLYSFCKLPGFQTNFLEKVIVFSQIQEMIEYFENNLNVSLPRKIVAKEVEKYQQLIEDAHNSRLKNEKLKNIRPLLSICIPSYNRGEKALRAVRRILQSKFDVEIEIVISNNGSTMNQEGYCEIKRMEDFRIHYYEFEENQGYASNIRQVLSLARGKFAVLSSDEDMMIIEHLPEYLKYLKMHVNDGVIICCGRGFNFLEENETCFSCGEDALGCAINLNYITGITYQMDQLKNEVAFEKFDGLRGNIFLEYYAHIVFAMLACQHTDVYQSGILLWYSADDPDESDDGSILSYMWPKSRIEQQNSSIELLDRMLDLNDELFLMMMYERMQKAYYLLYIAYFHRSNAFEQEFTWREICMELHENNEKVIERYMPVQSFKQCKQVINQIFFNWLNKHPLEDKMDSSERVKLETENKLAEYLVEKGIPIGSINFQEIEKKLKNTVC
ncbi:MAG: glycosyltransferase family 2 protein [Lachnospiraceae bacterium]|nr:glycosyltransferase family 2 protein [Lachnospiraceae bacterium]